MGKDRERGARQEKRQLFGRYFYHLNKNQRNQKDFNHFLNSVSFQFGFYEYIDTKRFVFISNKILDMREDNW